MVASKLKKASLALVFLAVSGAASFGALQPTKILTVDMEELYGNYTKAKKAQEEFAEEVQAAREEINELLQSGLKMGDEFQELKAKASNPALTEEARNKYVKEAETKAGEIQKKEMEINQFRNQSDQALAQRRETIINLHMTEIKGVIGTIAKNKGADLVLNTSGLMVLYHDNALDVTKDALTALNADDDKAASSKKK